MRQFVKELNISVTTVRTYMLRGILYTIFRPVTTTAGEVNDRQEGAKHDNEEVDTLYGSLSILRKYNSTRSVLDLHPTNIGRILVLESQTGNLEVADKHDHDICQVSCKKYEEVCQRRVQKNTCFTVLPIEVQEQRGQCIHATN